jgi:hypothetical protein
MAAGLWFLIKEALIRGGEKGAKRSPWARVAIAFARYEAWEAAIRLGTAIAILEQMDRATSASAAASAGAAEPRIEPTSADVMAMKKGIASNVAKRFGGRVDASGNVTGVKFQI